MSQRVAYVRPTHLTANGGVDYLWLTCAVYENRNWVRNRRLVIQYPATLSELTHDVMVGLDVGNVVYQHHLAITIPDDPEVLPF